MGAAAIVFALTFVLALAGDACHVASGTTEYLWPSVPSLGLSAIWFPFSVAASMTAIAGLGAVRYAANSDSLFGVAPWLPALYFAAAVTVSGLQRAIESGHGWSLRR
jgi:hypothetical protein